MRSEDILNIIFELNGEIHEAGVVPEDFCGFEYRTNGWSSIIEFCGIMLWNDDDDARTYLEETDEYEPLETYLRRESNKLINRISKLKF